ncbi:hypothetical protein Kpol_473p8 [Vanderwaltozyma polyspora DSM 70294]|uniref:5'-3' exoribonuclease n=1 Tax=Vanderwaltozyma polyspora (strain ATCC 22028 / DSM 70294 / BCRC 21397 / CBS 2163 / NBRC 10782 / NRRL Y-8283 / UCD 57-17) TaxID=436907 RepID=A7TQ00_VANPO|nr:uncharacterized protein Kpol_473p8 [Vanderwaltozyma polyspora DSM 70294]EDO15649.1 hypothetical protein Kpol_473p8 [Vanderwaltozyma polyspora DSM 70294]
MGVPSFFRWLSRKYPKIISPVLEDAPQVVDGVQLPIDYSAPNQNGELDNLYLDMNGIVHPCSHPENKPPPENEDEMLLAVFEYTNRVLNMARPRKVLMIAVDGVAPRAKMNQQRARRFRSARDAKIQDEAREEIMREKEEIGEHIDESVRNKKTWDSNAITPGTPFMDKLAAALRYWTAFKLATDPGWKNLQIIISDATVPGEGEHKIMNFIRSQRADPEYNPNTTHCIYGLDADLIFLGLATHEPHFKILREDVFAQGNNRKRHNFKDNINMTEEEKQIIMKEDSQKPFLWLHISVLREYLSAELWVQRLPFPFDLERAIDDWVFMCFFCGNDFLPHLPSLDVRENSIDILLDIWKVVLPNLKDYMTCDGELNLASVEKLLYQLGSREGDIFKTRHIQEIRKQEALQRRKLGNQKNLSQGQDRHPTQFNEQLQLYDTNGNLAKGSWNLTTSDMVKFKKELMLANEGDEEAIKVIKAQSDLNNKLENEINKEKEEEAINQGNIANFSAVDTMKKKLTERKRQLEQEENEDKMKNEKDTKKPKTESKEDELTNDIEAEIVAEVADELNDEEGEDGESGQNTEDTNDVVPGISPFEGTSGVIDTDESVRLYEPGYHSRYYTSKFNIAEENITPLSRKVVRSYIEGVSWVLLYYYQGCASWNWYYPYHYAPFASDFTNIADMEINFELGEPFLPYEQLMSVLPAASGNMLPKVFQSLMRNPDSEIVDFYPVEFLIDMNGKKMSWQGIALLPFIDEERLLKSVRSQYKVLTDSEKSRNVRNQEIVLISNKNVNYDKFVKELYTENLENPNFEQYFSHFNSGLSGYVGKDKEGFDLNSKILCPIQAGSLPTLSTNLFLKMSYRMLPLPTKNKSIILNGFVASEPMLTSYDLDSILYKYNDRNFYRNGNRNFGDDMKQNIVPVGPRGVTQYKPRVGGYRAFFHFEQMNNGHNNYNNNGTGNTSYENNGYNRGQQFNQHQGGSYGRYNNSNRNYQSDNYNANSGGSYNFRNNGNYNNRNRGYNNNGQERNDRNTSGHRGGSRQQSRYNGNWNQPHSGNYKSRYQ